MAERGQFSLQVRIGAFILSGLLVFFGIIYLLGSQARYFERKYDLVAEFTEVGGLIEGATVRLAGVQVGRVTEVNLPEKLGGKVRVTLTIARRYAERIRRDSEARIATQGLLGDKIVEITLGSEAAPPLKPGETLASAEPFEMQQMFKAGAETMQTVKELAAGLKTTVQRVDRIAKEVETGKGLVHALIYDEPEALHRLNALLTRTQQLLARAEQGDHAVGVLLSPESGKSVRSLLAAMDAIGRGAAQLEARDNLLSALLYDPQYKTVADDLRVVAHNFRDVSERVAQGQGLLGQLTRDGADGSLALGNAAADFRAAMANLRTVTDRLKAGEGTVGGLLEDPTVYENLVQFLEGARRSFLLRTLIRSTISSGSSSSETARGGAQ
ncbi:MAG TPA: MlaD family protein [Methylomirabilota bacterium]|jgi:phospholipid/cholesterol/gamma-HCH transport system substrate-binding protein